MHICIYIFIMIYAYINVSLSPSPSLSQMGSVGLDLSFVTHIFIMDPIWDPAMEAQVRSVCVCVCVRACLCVRVCLCVSVCE
jgi:hypothetical protein